jgi:uncharacterized protein
MARASLHRPALLVLAALLLLPVPARASGWTAYDRPATYGVVTENDVPITVRDGTVLEADVKRPDRPGRYPVLVTQTPYNKGNPAFDSVLGGASEPLVRRGYVQVVVDVRGTGGSQGSWDSFGTAEQHDGYDVVEWAAKQPWSDGSVGLDGASYMGLNQLLTAALHPPHLKAIFPVVPMADGYRDIVFSGGDTNVSFIPLWLGLVTGGGIAPPAYALSGHPDDLVRGLGALASHASGVAGFQANTLAGSITGGDIAYDGPFWRTRSPLEVVDQVRVPAFVVGGEHDLFQRGEPLIYERLKNRVPTRLLIGPWTHVEGATGAGLPADGVPSLPQIELRWFDHWLVGRDAKIEEIPQVTQFALGGGHYETQADWPEPKLAPRRWYLRGGQALAPEAPPGSEPSQSFTQQPLSGICTQSTAQWTAGLTGQLPCTTDDRPNETLGNAVYTSPPLAGDLRLDGPILADIWLATTAKDAAVTVRVTDVDPAGRSTELTAGWLAATFRAVDQARSRMVRGQLVQPWHPFTRASILPVHPGEPMELPVEVFPTNGVIPKGHRLRVTVSPSDFPHQMPPAPQLLAGLGGQDRVLTDPEHPSYVALPEVGDSCAVAAASTTGKAKKAQRRRRATPKAQRKASRRHTSGARPKRHRRKAARHVPSRRRAIRPAARRRAAGACSRLPVPDLTRGDQT